MRFSVEPAVFERLPTACFGAVLVQNVDNTQPHPAIAALLQESITQCEQELDGLKVKEQPFLACYREAFRALDINPNKYLCSMEALLTRIAKRKGFPSINPLVDLGNAVSIRRRLPIGAHDLGTVKEELAVRFYRPGDTFIAFGETEVETPDVGELLYVSGHQVRTRRWTWRQSEVGKIVPETRSILYPIDGFTDCNKAEVEQAAQELADLLAREFACTPAVGFLDREHPVWEVN